MAVRAHLLGMREHDLGDMRLQDPGDRYLTKSRGTWNP